MRTGNQERFQQLESTIQDKLQQAAERRMQLEQEQKEKLRNHVSKLISVLIKLLLTFYVLLH